MADWVGQHLGNYRLIGLLGTGGFAEVYLAEQVHLGSQAAIKVLHTHLAAPEEIDQFRTEARILATLVHPHIIRVFDFGVEQTTPYLVLEYAPNGSLRQRLPASTPLAPITILPYVKQVAEALNYAHEQKLIHRDIKPENLLLGRNNEVLLTDFGIATVAQNTSLQQTQGVAGTAAYMAPEQLQGKPRPASDLYSLAVVVYEWLTGERPFQGGPIEVATQQVLMPPPPLREKVPTLPPAVEQVVLTALAKDPKARFGSVRAFATALEQAIRLEAPASVSPLAPDTLATGLPTRPGAQSISDLPEPEVDAPSIFSAPTQLTPPPLPMVAPSPSPTWADPASSATPVPPLGRRAPGGLPQSPPVRPPRRRTGWVAVCSVLLVLLVAGSSLGILGANHLGPLAAFSGTGVALAPTIAPTFTATPASTPESWQIVASPNARSGSAAGNMLTGVVAFSSSDVWAVGVSSTCVSNGCSNEAGVIEHYNGTTWKISTTISNIDLSAMAAVAPNNIWVVGMAGTIVHYDGSTWQTFPTPDSSVNLMGVGADHQGDVWAAGTKTITATASGVSTKPIIEHLTSSGWVIASIPIPSPGNDNELQSVAVVSNTSVWVAGYVRPFSNLKSSPRDEQPLVEHFDGTHWQVNSLPSGVIGALYGIAATQNTVWAVGDMFLKYTNSSWQVQTPYYAPEYVSIVAISDSDAWVAGGNDIEHFDGRNWTPANVVYPPDRENDEGFHFSDIALVPGTSDTLWAVGEVNVSRSEAKTLIEEYS